MRSVAPSASPTLGGRASTGRTPLLNVHRLHVLAVVGLLALILGLLAYAETVWLHEALPQDRVSRVSLAAFPGTRPGTMAGPLGTASAEDWPARLTTEATSATLLETLSVQLRQDLPPSDASISAQELKSRMRVTAQCIQIASADRQGVQGLLLVNTVRGADGPELEAIARAWSKQVVETSKAEWPGLVVVPVESLSVPYETCRS